MPTRQAALSLYRKLFGLTKDLPRQVQAYYRNSIRSGFVSHGDEDDSEVLARIHSQALRDAEWVVNKYKAQQQGEQTKRR